MIDLRSDTVTLPTSEMKSAMMAAEVGDDVFSEDPTVNKLQDQLAKMFRKEDALFCTSGTMCNQLAIAAQTQSLDEIIIDKLSHIYNYETTGYAYNSRVGLKLVAGERGIIKLANLENTVNGDFDWLANTALLSIENTCNKGGGSLYTLSDMQLLSNFCKTNKLNFHLDGARLFNALVETKDSTSDIGPLFDSISICFSKGLGAPVGSVLLGSNKMIKKARRLRKAMGGGMRQAGYLAAACLFALEHNIERLKEDHNRAHAIADLLQTLPYVVGIDSVATNIVMFKLIDDLEMNAFIDYLKINDIHAMPFGPKYVRFVTHMGITDEKLEKVLFTLAKFNK